MNTRDPMQLNLPLTLRSKDEAFCAGLKAGFKFSERKHNITGKRFYAPKLSDYDLHKALQEFQRTS